MGKRELLLVAAFAIVGLLVYQVTAPPPAPGERSFSIHQLINNIRREVGGNRSNAEMSTPSTHPVPPQVTELRLNLRSQEVTVTGEDRADIAAELHVRSTGYDPGEAEQLAKATTLKLDQAGASIIATLDYPKGGQQFTKLVLKVPAGLGVRMETHRGPLRISGVKTVEIVSASGNTEVRKIAGRVAANQTGGDLIVSDAGSVKLTTRGSDVTLEHVRGDVTLTTRSGELKATGLVGPIELESNSTDVTLDKLETTTGTVRVNAVNGTLTLRGLRADGRIDARNAEVTVDIDRAAPLAIYAEGEEDVRITAPRGGFQLDAVARNGRVTVPDGTVKVDVTGDEQRAGGAVRGGGATITVRANRGDIVIKDRAVAER